MKFLKNVALGEYSLAFTFWVMSCIGPTPFFISKVYLRDAGVFTHEDPLIYVAGQVFLWVEWFYFAFITVAIWNSSSKHLERHKMGGPEKAIWGHSGRLLAVASGLLAVGAFSNLSGLTTLIFGKPLFIGMGGG